ncbi:Rid family hydrolase [Streptomyces sp. NPDC097610]|uniref:RidA family protein n=1 Tax=Streptomyces sp. NPDC097610 TaxID=3157227 RepID=UPI00333494BC
MTVRSRELSFGMPWESLYGFNQALQVGDTLYVCGQLSHNSTGAFVGAGDFELQARTTLENLDRVLEHFSTDRDPIVETTVLVKDLREYFDTVAQLHAAYCGDHRPTSTVRHHHRRDPATGRPPQP